MSELPGTPGTPLPPSPAEPQIHQGDAGRLRQQLGNIPLEAVSPDVQLGSPTQAPNEPVTAGVNMGMGPGSEALLDSPQQLSSKLSAQEIQHMYPLLLRLATLPNATTETKILAQRVRANLPVAPEHMPIVGPPNGIPGQS